MSKNVSLINHYHKLSPRVENEVRSLVQSGYSVHIVYFDRTLNKEDTYGMDELEGCQRTHVLLKVSKGRLLLVGAIPLLYAKLFSALRSEKPDIIHCTHLFLLPFCVAFAKFKGAKIVYDASEMHAIDWAEYVSLCPSMVRKIIEILENWLVAQVSYVLTIDSVDNFLANRYLQVNPNVTVLYNVPWKEVAIQPDKIECLKKKYHGAQLLVYVGGSYEAKGLLVTLEALQFVKEKISTVRLLSIGKVDDPKGKVEKLLQIGDLRAHVEFIPWLPYVEMFHYLHLAKVGLALHQPTGRFLLVSRGNGRKFFTYMQAGLPVVAPAFGEIAQVVKEERCGILVDTTDPHQVAEAILDLLTHPEKAKEMGKRGWKAVQEKYCWEKEQEKLIRAYRSLS